MGRIPPGHPWGFQDFETGAIAPLLSLKRAGFLLIAASNECGFLRLGFTRADLDRLRDSVSQVFSLDDYLVCRHEDADLCPCRKPRPGLLTEAAFKWHLDLDHSFVIGNRWQDAETARNAGCVSLLIQSPWIGRGHHDFVLPDLSSIAAKVLELKEYAAGAALSKWLAVCAQ